MLTLLALLACDKPVDDSPAPQDSAGPDTVFTLAVIPDTQFYPLGYEAVLDEMMDWIAFNAEVEDIAFVLHEGDQTHNNSLEEWAHAEDALRRLDEVVPYAMCVGNHDMDDETGTANFNATYPRPVQAQLPGFGGTLDLEVMDNAWHSFSAGGTDWLVVSLTYDPSDEELAWGAQLVQDNPDKRVIVLTHAYLAPDGTRTSVGERVWQAVAEPYNNVALVLNGHFTGGEAAHLVSEGTTGNPVAQIFANYQMLSIGGMGRIRLMEVDTAAGTIRVRTYAPPFDVWATEEYNDFLLEGLELGAL